jgi:biotin carboxyl carrier protein
MMKKITTAIAICLIVACHPKAADDTADEATTATETPVTITHPSKEAMSETVQVNAISAFLLKTYAKATANGYLQTVNVHVGDMVTKGEVLFVIKTKEAEALGNTVNSLDTSLHFQGIITIKSPRSGYITQLTYTAGNYVQDGEQLAEITDNTSFVFILDLPYELKPYLDANKNLNLHLPDSTVIPAVVESALPSVDSVAQTQQYILKANTDKHIPANLIAKADIIKSQKLHTVSLPKAAVLSNETQSEFWIMKMLNDSVAVKVPVTKGLENKSSVEILSPVLSDSDNIIITGNYGLSDTASVKITRE